MPDTAVAPPPRTGGGSGGSGIGQMLRDPDHYEEINVIGNGKLNVSIPCLLKFRQNVNNSTDISIKCLTNHKFQY